MVGRGAASPQPSTSSPCSGPRSRALRRETWSSRASLWVSPALPHVIELLLGDGSPTIVDDLGGVAADLRRRALEVLRPEREPRVAGERRIVRDHVQLGVVEE